MVFEKVAALIADHLDISKDDIQLATTFDELGVDSLDMMQMVMELEDEFNIQIEVETGLKSVQDLVSYIESK